MSSEEEAKQPEVAEQQSSIDYKTLYEKAQQDLTAVAAKKDELLKETKRAKAEREETIQRAEQEKAIKDGEFEKLWKTAQQEKEELNKRLQSFAQENRQEKIKIAAIRLSTELADGDNAELLSDFVSRNLEKLADETGHLGDDVINAVRNDFKANQKFKSLLRQSKATGGGAPGNTSSAQAKPSTLTRQEFNALDFKSRKEFLKNGSLTD